MLGSLLKQQKIHICIHGGSNHRFCSDALTTRPCSHLEETVVSGTLPKIIILFVQGIFYPKEKTFLEHLNFFLNYLVTVP